jgi:predicted nucleotidyltransferase
MNLSHPLDGIVDLNTARILLRLAILPQGETGRRIHDLSAVNALRTTQRILGELVAIGLVQVEPVGAANRYVLNRSHTLWEPLEALLASPSRVEHAIGEKFSEVAPKDTIAVYGSFARGAAGRDSDIDILVVWDAQRSLDDRDAILTEVAAVAESMTGNVAHIVDVDSTKLSEMVTAKDPLALNWLAEARTVTGTPVADLIRKAHR